MQTTLCNPLQSLWWRSYEKVKHFWVA